MPPALQHLYTAQDAASKHFRTSVCSFNTITDFDDFSISAAAYYFEHWATRVRNLISAALIHVKHESFRVAICVDWSCSAIANSQMQCTVGDDVAETVGTLPAGLLSTLTCNAAEMHWQKCYAHAHLLCMLFVPIRFCCIAYERAKQHAGYSCCCLFVLA